MLVLNVELGVATAISGSPGMHFCQSQKTQVSKETRIFYTKKAFPG